MCFFPLVTLTLLTWFLAFLWKCLGVSAMERMNQWTSSGSGKTTAERSMWGAERMVEPVETAHFWRVLSFPLFSTDFHQHCCPEQMLPFSLHSERPCAQFKEQHSEHFSGSWRTPRISQTFCQWEALGLLGRRMMCWEGAGLALREAEQDLILLRNTKSLILGSCCAIHGLATACCGYQPLLSAAINTPEKQAEVWRWFMKWENRHLAQVNYVINIGYWTLGKQIMNKCRTM